MLGLVTPRAPNKRHFVLNQNPHAPCLSRDNAKLPLIKFQNPSHTLAAPHRKRKDSKAPTIYLVFNSLHVAHYIPRGRYTNTVYIIAQLRSCLCFGHGQRAQLSRVHARGVR